MILEIGSNDGAFIKNFKKNCVIGVEPCKNLAKITRDKGYKTFSEYWDVSLAKKISKSRKLMSFIPRTLLVTLKIFQRFF